MDLFTELKKVYPELELADFHPLTGSISVIDDGDGVQYINKWEFSKALPKGLKLGK
jgi:hypothetical protein